MGNLVGKGESGRQARLLRWSRRILPAAQESARTGIDTLSFLRCLPGFRKGGGGKCTGGPAVAEPAQHAKDRPNFAPFIACWGLIPRNLFRWA
jgi:hypothetical protein